MSSLTEPIIERLSRLDQNQQERVLDFIQHIEQTTWTAEELAEAHELITNPQPKTNAEIIAMLEAMRPTGWEDIEDGAAWVAEQRRRNRERSQW